jgi:hypothetical protein
VIVVKAGSVKRCNKSTRGFLEMPVDGQKVLLKAVRVPKEAERAAIKVVRFPK